MNPAGIVFGPNASLNVGGSVSFTTADYLRLADGAKFTALPSSSDAAISSAPVAAFGFLGSNPAAITLQGGRLAVAEGQSLSLVGGNIEITAGALPDGSAQAARLSAPGGQIALVSAASPGEVSLSMTSKPAADASLGAFASRGTISLAISRFKRMTSTCRRERPLPRPPFTAWQGTSRSRRQSCGATSRPTVLRFLGQHRSRFPVRAPAREAREASH
jgi:hypothetical protein